MKFLLTKVYIQYKHPGHVSMMLLLWRYQDSQWDHLLPRSSAQSDSGWECCYWVSHWSPHWKKKTIKLNSHKTLNCFTQTMCVNTFHSRILQYGVEGSTVPQLPTHNLSILLTPGGSRGVCTNCPPYTTAANLYSTNIWKCNEKSSDKPHRVFLTVAGLSCGTNWCPL